MPVAAILLYHSGKLFNQTGAIIANKSYDIGSFHQLDSIFVSTDRILARIGVFQKDKSMKNFSKLPSPRVDA
jgi:hypothetical protein